ncbi:MAG: SH3 domain-containing protein [Clostridiaceae bacterium]
MNKIILSSLITSLAVMGNLFMPAAVVSALDYEQYSYTGTQTASERSGTVINGIKISRQLINKNYNKERIIKPQYIVIHDTDNRRYGADAQANRNYFAYQLYAKASAHYLVDHDSIIQALEDNWYGWHLGDKINPRVGNNNSIGIELCVNMDNDFSKTLENGIALTKYLMKKYDISAENVIRHYDVTGKICPKMMIWDKPYLWNYFKASLENNSFSVTTGNESVSGSGTICNVAVSANMRSAASISSKVIASLKSGSRIDIIKAENSWYKVSATVNKLRITGYVHKDYVSLDSETKKALVDKVPEKLNVREGPGTNYSVIGFVLNGESIEILSSEGNWYKIQYSTVTGKKQGYVLKTYVKFI